MAFSGVFYLLVWDSYYIARDLCTQRISYSVMVNSSQVFSKSNVTERVITGNACCWEISPQKSQGKGLCARYLLPYRRSVLHPGRLTTRAPQVRPLAGPWLCFVQRCPPSGLPLEPPGKEASSGGKNISFELDTPHCLFKDWCLRSCPVPDSVLLPLL